VTDKTTDVNGLAELLDLPVNEAYRLLWTGTIPSTFDRGRAKVRLADVEAYVASLEAREVEGEQ